MSLSELAARWWGVAPSRTQIVLPLLLVASLYWASSLPGIPSPEDPVLYGVFLWLPPTLQNALHVPAYAILTLAWRWALRAWLRSPSACALAACAIALVCGVLDEWNQSFVPGRSASLTDIVLNGVGVAVGIGLAAWIESRTAAIPG
jgi:VanZ family protein